MTQRKTKDESYCYISARLKDSIEKFQSHFDSHDGPLFSGESTSDVVSVRSENPLHKNCSFVTILGVTLPGNFMNILLCES